MLFARSLKSRLATRAYTLVVLGIALLCVSPAGRSEEAKKESSCNGHTAGEGPEFAVINAAKGKCEVANEAVSTARSASDQIEPALQKSTSNFNQFTTGAGGSNQAAIDSTKSMLEQSIKTMEAALGNANKAGEMQGKGAALAGEWKNKLITSGNKIQVPLTDYERQLSLNTALAKGSDNAARSTTDAAMQAIHVQSRDTAKKRADEAREKIEKIKKAVAAHKSAISDHEKVQKSAAELSKKIEGQKQKLNSSISQAKAQLTKLNNVKLGQEGKSKDDPMEGMSGGGNYPKAVPGDKDGDVKGKDGDVGTIGEKTAEAKVKDLTPEEKKIVENSHRSDALKDGFEAGKAAGPGNADDKTEVGQKITQKSVEAQTRTREAIEQQAEAGGEKRVAEIRDDVKRIHELDKEVYDDGKSYPKDQPLPADVQAKLDERNKRLDNIKRDELGRLEASNLKLEPVTARSMSDDLNTEQKSCVDSYCWVEKEATHGRFLGNPSEKAFKDTQRDDYGYQFQSGLQDERKTLVQSAIRTSEEGDRHANNLANASSAPAYSDPMTGWSPGDGAPAEQDIIAAKERSLAGVVGNNGYASGVVAAQSGDADRAAVFKGVQQATSGETGMRIGGAVAGFVPGGSAIDYARSVNFENGSIADAAASGYSDGTVKVRQEATTDRQWAAAGGVVDAATLGGGAAFKMAGKGAGAALDAGSTAARIENTAVDIGGSAGRTFNDIPSAPRLDALPPPTTARIEAPSTARAAQLEQQPLTPVMNTSRDVTPVYTGHQAEIIDAGSTTRSFRNSDSTVQALPPPAAITPTEAPPIATMTARSDPTPAPIIHAADTATPVRAADLPVTTARTLPNDAPVIRPVEVPAVPAPEAVIAREIEYAPPPKSLPRMASPEFDPGRYPVGTGISDHTPTGGLPVFARQTPDAPPAPRPAATGTLGDIAFRSSNIDLKPQPVMARAPSYTPPPTPLPPSRPAEFSGGMASAFRSPTPAPSASPAAAAAPRAMAEAGSSGGVGKVVTGPASSGFVTQRSVAPASLGSAFTAGATPSPSALSGGVRAAANAADSAGDFGSAANRVAQAVPLPVAAPTPVAHATAVNRLQETLHVPPRQAERILVESSPAVVKKEVFAQSALEDLSISQKRQVLAEVNRVRAEYQQATKATKGMGLRPPTSSGHPRGSGDSGFF